MTCPCKAELASILRDTGGPIGIAAWAQSVADRLDAPSPAPAEPQEPCMVVEYPDGRFGIETADNLRFWVGNKWHKYFKKNDPRCGWGNFDTRASAVAALPAARAALLAASEPGKPAPAPFDAAKWAEKMVREFIPGQFALHEHDGGGYCAFLMDHASVARARHATSIVAAALTAAHEAGKAAGQPRFRYEVLNAKKEVIAAFRDHYSATVFCNGLDGRSVVDTQPSPPAEKGGAR